MARGRWRIVIQELDEQDTWQLTVYRRHGSRMQQLPLRNRFFDSVGAAGGAALKVMVELIAGDVVLTHDEEVQ